MTSKQTVEYLRITIEKWELIIEGLDDDDPFKKVCQDKCLKARNEVKNIVKTKSPEDFF